MCDLKNLCFNETNLLIQLWLGDKYETGEVQEHTCVVYA